MEERLDLEAFGETGTGRRQRVLRQGLADPRGSSRPAVKEDGKGRSFGREWSCCLDGEEIGGGGPE